MAECKVLRDSDWQSLAWTVERGVEQALGYVEKRGAEEGHPAVSTAAARNVAGTRGRTRGSGELGQERRKVSVWTPLRIVQPDRGRGSFIALAAEQPAPDSEPQRGCGHRSQEPEPLLLGGCGLGAMAPGPTYVGHQAWGLTR